VPHHLLSRGVVRGSLFRWTGPPVVSRRGAGVRVSVDQVATSGRACLVLLVELPPGREHRVFTYIPLVLQRVLKPARASGKRQAPVAPRHSGSGGREEDVDRGSHPWSPCVSSAGWCRAPTRMIDVPVTRSSLRGSLSRWTGPPVFGIVCRVTPPFVSRFGPRVLLTVDRAARFWDSGSCPTTFVYAVWSAGNGPSSGGPGRFRLRVLVGTDATVAVGGGGELS
jgi:hypothetical protein